jgi:VIT1/CCC1 family predicted Fe2+/Mn2+ transporter
MNRAGELVGASISKEMKQKLEHSHTEGAIAARIGDRHKHSYLRDFVYGAIDGTVTTFAVVCGVAGAGLDSRIVIVLGMANLIGDGFSMAASNYLSTRTEEQLRERAVAMERRHIQQYPEGEREEIRQIFAGKGFRGPDLDRAVAIITADVDRWIDTMLVDELGLSLHGPSPLKAAGVTFLAFCGVGLLPLLVFAYGLFVPGESAALYLLSTLMTAAAFFLVGAAKSLFVQQRWYWSGLETLAIGGIAAALAYVVGRLFKGIVG